MCHTGYGLWDYEYTCGLLVSPIDYDDVLSAVFARVAPSFFGALSLSLLSPFAEVLQSPS